MPSNIPPGYGLMTWRFLLTGDNEEMVSTCGVDISDLGGAFQSYVDGVSAAFKATFSQATIQNVYTFKGCRLYVGQDGGASSVYEKNETYTGTGSSGPLPSNCAFLVRKLSALGGRSHRGRQFWPPFALGEGDIDANGNLTTTGYNARATMFSDVIMNNLSGTTGAFAVILHSPALGALAPTPITSAVLQQKIATMRRRLRR